MLLEFKRVFKSYQIGKNKIPVLQDLDLFVNEGEFVSIMGTSGSGKSTLLHILGGLDTPDEGTYRFNARDMLSLSDEERSWIRGHWLGFVFQTFNLLSELDVVGNVSLPFTYRKTKPEKIASHVEHAIDRVGLLHRKGHRPFELSGGEMQRVAIARALAVNPKMILADEPTGNLDSRNSEHILDLFRELHQTGTSIILVSHDEKVAAVSERILQMEDGCLQ